MFEINKYLLSKMGWMEYSLQRGVGVQYQSHSVNKPIVVPFAEDPLVRFFIDIKDQYICYVIKEFSKEEKQQNPGKSYKFIRMDYRPETLEERGQPKFLIKEFNSNTELFQMVVKHKACNNEYQRHFLINNILNEKD